MSDKIKQQDGKPSGSVPCSARLAFERWISSPPFEKRIDRFEDDCRVSAWPGSYVDIDVDLAWQAWKEATEAPNYQPKGNYGKKCEFCGEPPMTKSERVHMQKLLAEDDNGGSSIQPNAEVSYGDRERQSDTHPTTNQP